GKARESVASKPPMQNQPTRVSSARTSDLPRIVAPTMPRTRSVPARIHRDPQPKEEPTLTRIAVAMDLQSVHVCRRSSRCQRFDHRKVEAIRQSLPPPPRLDLCLSYNFPALFDSTPFQIPLPRVTADPIPPLRRPLAIGICPQDQYQSRR